MIAQESSTPDNAQPAGIRPWLAVAAALIAGNCLLLVAPPGPMRTAGALLTLVLPGLALAEVLLSNTSRLLRWTVGAGLGYAFIIIAGLALAYSPGPLSRWGVLMLADGLSLLLIVILLRSGKRAASPGDGSRLIPLVMILLVAGFFRFASLGYSEFQGDEVKAMMPAARVLAGDPDALMLERKKGPAEILLPMLPWRLAETTDEASARLPFALAGLGTLVTVFLLGRKLGGDPAGFAAAGVAALNGLLIAFSRIVQYQAVVLWMSALAVLCAWEWYERGRTRWVLLAGVFTGIGLLAHYDALAVMPVLAYIALLAFSRSNTLGRRRAWWRDALLGALCMALVVVPFYGPYLLTPQVGATASYLGKRIGEGLLKNTIDKFLTYSTFYNSFLYIALTGGLILAFMAWRVHSAPALRRIPGGRVWVPALLVMIAAALMVWPAGLTIGSIDLAPLAWLLIFLAAILLPSPSPVVQGTLTLAGGDLHRVQFPAGGPQDAHLRHLPALEPARRRRVGRVVECPCVGAMALGRYRAGCGRGRMFLPVPVRHLSAARWPAQHGSACNRASVGVGAGTVHHAADRRYFRHGASRRVEDNRCALCRGQACGRLRRQRKA